MLTVGELKEALAGVPNHLRVVVHVELEGGDAESVDVDEFAEAYSVEMGKDAEGQCLLVRM